MNTCNRPALLRDRTVALALALVLALPVLLATLGAPQAHAARARVYESYAHVNRDATLSVRGTVIHLHGVYIPPTGRTCDRTFRPRRCASRAALALDFKIQGFVRCEERVRFADRSISALCTLEGEDLGAYLVSRGWAVAGPAAPFEYTVLERIARERAMGVWGFHVDRVTGTVR